MHSDSYSRSQAIDRKTLNTCELSRDFVFKLKLSSNPKKDFKLITWFRFFFKSTYFKSAIEGSVETEGVSPQVEQPEKFWSCSL